MREQYMHFSICPVGTYKISCMHVILPQKRINPCQCTKRFSISNFGNVKEKRSEKNKLKHEAKIFNQHTKID